MRRVQVQLTDAQVAALQERASAQDRPVAALVREAVDAWLTDADRRRSIERAMSVIGKFRSGLSDVSENHDEYIGQAIEEDLGRR